MPWDHFVNVAFVLHTCVIVCMFFLFTRNEACSRHSHVWTSRYVPACMHANVVATLMYSTKIQDALTSEQLNLLAVPYPGFEISSAMQK